MAAVLIESPSSQASVEQDSGRRDGSSGAGVSSGPCSALTGCHWLKSQRGKCEWTAEPRQLGVPVVSRVSSTDPGRV